MKKIFLILILISAVYTAKAQNLIAVQNGNNAIFYTNLDTAIINAPSGSIIYIPGGSFAINTTIDKTLNIIGIGHNPNYSTATNYTYITGNVNLISGAGNGSLTGLYISGNINIGTNSTNDFVNYLLVNRCNFLSLYFSGNENIINSGGNLFRSSNNFFGNNIINGQMGQTNCGGYDNNIGINNTVTNNIFLFNTSNYCPGCCSWDNSLYKLSIICKSSLIKNNIFVGSTLGLYAVSNSIVNNNLFVENISFPNGSNIGANNLVNQAQSSIFVNQTGNTFSYTDDYHLQPGCPGKNAGTDGTDIGIYGGASPWKDGSVPNNPHVINSYIGGATNNNGALPVNIKVEAQGN